MVWLGPHDEAPFRALTELAFAAFPACPPYGGQYADVIPHLTVGHRGGASAFGASALGAAGEAVEHRLPIEATATEVTLMTGPPPGNPGIQPGQWRTMAAFGLDRPGRLPAPTG